MKLMNVDGTVALEGAGDEIWDYMNSRFGDLRGLDLSDGMGGSFVKIRSLSGYDLRGSKLPPGIPVVPDIDARILERINTGGTLDMRDWHNGISARYDPAEDVLCGTTHCRAGWAVVEAGEAGVQLAKECIGGTSSAGGLIYAASRPDKPIPDFYASNRAAMDDIRKCAAEQRAKA